MVVDSVAGNQSTNWSDIRRVQQGPRTEPCGTPVVIGNENEVDPPDTYGEGSPSKIWGNLLAAPAGYTELVFQLLDQDIMWDCIKCGRYVEAHQGDSVTIIDTANNFIKDTVESRFCW